MTHKRKMKTSAKIIISALALALCAGLFFVLIKSMKGHDSIDGNSNNQNQQTTESTDNESIEPSGHSNNQEEGSREEAQLIENEGDIEIIIPDDQESDGF